MNKQLVSVLGNVSSLLLILLFTSFRTGNSFSLVGHDGSGRIATRPTVTRLSQTGEDSDELLEIKKLLSEGYPAFLKLLESNDEAWKSLLGGDEEDCIIDITSCKENSGDLELG